MLVLGCVVVLLVGCVFGLVLFVEFALYLSVWCFWCWYCLVFLCSVLLFRFGLLVCVCVWCVGVCFVVFFMLNICSLLCFK